jgi:hypothetical protein
VTRSSCLSLDIPTRVPSWDIALLHPVAQAGVGDPRSAAIGLWASLGLTDIQDQVHSTGKDVHYGDHGAEDTPSPSVVHPDFKADIVERCRAGDRSIGQVAKDFVLTETAVRAWVKQAEVWTPAK